jgi:nicotinate-nucleotide--dimethylbenzimidazole phosphoribosyltransferase
MSRVFDCVAAVKPANQEAKRLAGQRLSRLTMPPGAMGQLMDTAQRLSTITGGLRAPTRRRCIVVMVADHGVCAEGVSAFPQAVTLQMVRNFVAGGATINAMASNAGADVQVVDMGCCEPFQDLYLAGQVDDQRVAAGTGNIAREAAMSLEQAETAICKGFDLAREIADDYDLIGTGEMGIGNTTPSAALASVFCQRLPEEVTGRGTGIDDAGHEHKVATVQRALDRAQVSADQPLRALAELGGFEIGGLCGLILGIAAAGKPVVLDGLITTAAALVAQALCPVVSDYLIPAHRSAEPGHRIMLSKLGCKPLLDLDLRLGEGTGAALAMPLIGAAARLLTDVATFDEARVADG